MGFPRLSYGFPMVFLWFSYGFHHIPEGIQRLQAVPWDLCPGLRGHGTASAAAATAPAAGGAVAVKPSQ